MRKVGFFLNNSLKYSIIPGKTGRINNIFGKYTHVTIIYF